MAITDRSPGPERPGAPSVHDPVAHEHSDVDVRGILWFCVGLIAIAAVIHVAVWLLFVAFERRTAAADPAPAPLAQPAGQLPPSPRLQTRPVNDLKALRAEEEALLHGEGQAGEQPGAYRIPIERAKQLIVERGVPVRTQP
jgi:hypothetical protein